MKQIFLLTLTFFGLSSYGYFYGPKFGCTGICLYHTEAFSSFPEKDRKKMVKTRTMRSVEEAGIEIEDACDKICRENSHASKCELERAACGQRNYTPFYYYYEYEWHYNN